MVIKCYSLTCVFHSGETDIKRDHRPLFIMMIMRPHDVDYLVKQTIIKHAQISPFLLGEDDLKLSRSCHHRQAGCFDLIWSRGH